jgi:7-carboxy-7-deazaguanine synthase
LSSATAAAVHGPGSRTDARLRITETFLSIQGEADAVGWPTFFIRLTGCPLRCGYCDTTYAFQGGSWMSVADLVDAARAGGVRRVCVTGGEPLAQRDCRVLLEALCSAGFAVSLETSGAMDISGIDDRVSRVMDLKTPGSGEAARNRWENLPLLSGRDQLKIVVCSREDYEWARGMLAAHARDIACPVLLSPSWGQVEPRDLAAWILEDRLDVRLQLQLHKYLWGNEPGR